MPRRLCRNRTNINENITSEQLAALDLGSNSFHLLIAQKSGDRIIIIDKYKEMVRLGEGLIGKGRLEKKISRRALECLARIAERLRSLSAENIRIVGTNTLRQLSPDDPFVSRAEAVLGHPIEIISGREEARLIYLGVCQKLGENTNRQLVVDIGGGSTELIIGHNFSPSALESLHMGCVSMTRQHFKSEENLHRAFRHAIDEALIELEPIAQTYLQSGWNQVIGASGTINSVVSVQAALNLGTQITLGNLYQIQQEIIDRGSAKPLQGLSVERADVFAGGLAILIAIFRTFDLHSMEASQSALREGVIYDLVGRRQNSDVRNQTVANLCQRFAIDRQQARRVQQTAAAFFEQIHTDWELNPDTSGQLLKWAAQLHEIGMDVSHNAYHKHGAYLLSHMDMPGFSRTEQAQLATLVGMHRRKLQLSMVESSPPWVVKLGLLFRIAALLHRHRSNAERPVMSVSGQVQRSQVNIALTIDHSYLEEHPLTHLDLQNEVDLLAAVGISLQIQAV